MSEPEAFTIRIHAVVFKVEQPYVEAAMTEAIGYDCTGSLYMELSPTGQRPATHAGVSTDVRPSDLAAMAPMAVRADGSRLVWRGRCDPYDGPEVVEAGPDDPDPGPDGIVSMERVLGKLGLKRIPDPAPPT